MEFLILVHPGSLCGSADFNLGPAEARRVRQSVIDDLNHWEGGVLVLDGDLSDELARHEDLKTAIDDALARARAAGIGQRLAADDPEHIEIALEFLAEKAIAKDTPIRLTGAWHHPDEADTGCVTTCHAELVRNGFMNARILESVATLYLDEPEGIASRPGLR